MRVVALLVVLGFVFAFAEAATPREVHVRFTTDHHGPVHVWKPAGYDEKTAVIVIFVHGYFANVDAAWRTYHLVDQFRASRLNAVFIACEAPTGTDDIVRWRSAEELLTVVASHVSLPTGRTIAIGHSGAHRTFDYWRGGNDIDTFVLIDAAYGDLGPYRTWLEARDDHRFVDIAELTEANAAAFHADFDDSRRLDKLPRSADELPDDITSARIIYARSSIGHMELVTSGVAIPVILRMLTAPVISGNDTPEKHLD